MASTTQYPPGMTPGELRTLLGPLDYQQRLDYVRAVVWGGDLDDLITLRELTFSSAPRKLPFPPELVDEAVRSGHRVVAQWLLEQMAATQRPVEPPLGAAVESGRVELFQWVLEEFKVELSPGDPRLPELMELAGQGGHRAIADHLHQVYGVPYSTSLMIWAASVGQVDLMNELRTVHQVALPPTVLQAAIERGQLGAVNYYLGTIDDDVCQAMDEAGPAIRAALLVAVERGHVSVIERLYKRYESLEPDLVKAAIKHGQVKVLRALDQRSPLAGDPDEVDRLFVWSGKYGQLGVLRYLHNIGLRPSEFILRRLLAASRVSVAAVDFLRLRGAAVDEAVLAAAQPHPAVAEYLREREEPLPSGLALVARHGLVSVLARFQAEGAPLTTALADQAAEFGQQAVLEWLYQRGVRASATGLLRALEHEFNEVVEWLLDRDHSLLTEPTVQERLSRYVATTGQHQPKSRPSASLGTQPERPPSPSPSLPPTY